MRPMEFQKPYWEQPYFVARYLRVGDSIYYTGENNNFSTTFEALANEDGITEELFRLWSEDPVQVDAGLMSVDNRLQTVELEGRSSSLELPRRIVEVSARELSVQAVQKRSPGYAVTSKPLR